MWLQQRDERCPLTARLHKIRNVTCNVTFPMPSFAWALLGVSQQGTPSNTTTASGNTTAQQSKERCSLPHTNDLDSVPNQLSDAIPTRNGAPICYSPRPKPAEYRSNLKHSANYGIPVSFCDLLRFQVDVYTAHLVAERLHFLKSTDEASSGMRCSHSARRTSDHAISVQDPTTMPTAVAPTDSPESFGAVTAAATLCRGALSSDGTPDFGVEISQQPQAAKDGSAFSHGIPEMLALGFPKGRVALYTATAASDDNSSLMQGTGCVSNETGSSRTTVSSRFSLATTQQFSLGQEEFVRPTVTSLALSLLHIPARNDESYTVLMASGASDGRFIVWTISVPVIHSQGMNTSCSIASLFTGDSPGRAASVTTNTFVHVQTVLPPKVPVPVFDIALVSAWDSGDVFQLKLSVSPAAGRSTEKDRLVKLWKLTSFQRRRLWQPDASLGTVVDAQVRCVCPTSFATEPTKIVIFCCTSGIVALQMFPSLQLIFRRVHPCTTVPYDTTSFATAPLNCSFCFFDMWDLCGFRSLQCEKKKSIRSSSKPSGFF